jgi:hypothetical protein
MTALWAFPVVALIVLAGSTSGSGHPGGLNAVGCHTNRRTGEYHCHRSGAKPQRLLIAPRKIRLPCIDLPRCRGCGCKGGPGYRSNRTGKCVGYKQLITECGNPPTLRCVFENAENTGVNRECVLRE